MRTVLITGASSGIGQVTSGLFRDEGWNVAATMRSPEASSLTPDDRVFITRLDVTDEESISVAVDAVVDRFGALDVIVNNAGFGQYGIFEAVPPHEVRRQFEVNVFGPMAVIRAGLAHLRSSDRGAVVNVSSGGGLYGLPMTSVYCASKYALEGFTEAVSYELRGIGIAVKLVVPHGGVSGTEFAARSAMVPVPDNYDAYVTRSWTAAGDRPAPEPVSATEVAATIFTAATDATDQLRYLVGNDTRHLIAALDLPLHEREQRLRQLLE